MTTRLKALLKLIIMSSVPRNFLMNVALLWRSPPLVGCFGHGDAPPLGRFVDVGTRRFRYFRDSSVVRSFVEITRKESPPLGVQCLRAPLVGEGAGG